MTSEIIKLPTHKLFRNLTGSRYGRLLVVQYLGRPGRKHLWLCACDCGNQSRVSSSELGSGNSTSCGCISAEKLSKRNTKHGSYGTPEYRTWRHMLDRCENPNDQDYARYGGRGISACERWHSFDKFLADMGLRPTDGSYEIDRRDNDGNYEPSNCRWVTKKTNARNRSTNHLLSLNGLTLALVEWSEQTGLPEGTIRDRLKRGWTVRDALTRPGRGKAVR